MIKFPTAARFKEPHKVKRSIYRTELIKRNKSMAINTKLLRRKIMTAKNNAEMNFKLI